MSNATILATPDGFRRWLQSGELDAPVGRAGDPDNCPLAWFLLAQGAAACEVEHTRWRTRGGRFYALKPWARAFVRAVDLLPLWRMLTAREALALLLDRGEARDV